MRPIGNAADVSKRRHVSPTENGRKRMRLDEEEEEIEQGRRAASVAHSNATFGARLEEPTSGDLEFGNDSMAFDDYQLEVPNGEVNMTVDGARSRSVSLAPSQRSRSRFSTPGWGEGGASFALSCPIAIFDPRHPDATQTQDETDLPETQEEGPESKGYSKNTVKALGLIRKELQPSEDDEDAEAPTHIGFKNMAAKVRRVHPK